MVIKSPQFRHQTLEFQARLLPLCSEACLQAQCVAVCPGKSTSTLSRRVCDLQAVALADKDGSFCRMLGVEIADAKEGEPKTQRCDSSQPPWQ